ncbi:MAG: transglycosylase SLT domain-containing protein [Desulfobacula sp.]|nr:transglycosylase SLT domain-containing protein [Desulfobacula sp.]
MALSFWYHLKNKFVCIGIITAFVLTPGFMVKLEAAVSLDQSLSPASTLDLDFPLYPSIKPNVVFWVDIFTKFSKSQGVIHDSRNLGIIYEIIKLDSSNTLRARKKNRKIIKQVVKKYKAVLLKLSRNQQPVSKLEKKVAAFFGPNTTLKDFKNAAYNIRCQTGLKQEFKKGLQRSGAVIDEFKRIFRSHGLPVDLIYLPCVESSYNFKAYSKFGAAGIWQFTHSTGRQYMKIEYAVDERRDPYISTNAAARLLKKNYAQLKEWPMAITAYNHGLAGMRRAKKSKGSYERIVKYYRSRSFKFASRNFYSEFLAARVVAKNPEKYFGNIKYYKPVEFQVERTKGYLSVKQLSDLLNIKIQKIKILNPALRKPVFNGQKYIPKGYNLRLPKNLPVQNFKKKLAALYKNKQKPSRFHRVRKGDTAGSIARVHSVKLNDLMLANNLNRRATIYIGQNLRIPVNGGTQVENRVVLAKAEAKSVKQRKQNKSVESTSELKGEHKPAQKIARPVKKVVESVKPAEKSVKQVEKSVKSVMESQAKPVKDEIAINPDIVTANLNIIKTFSKGSKLFGVIRVETEETLGHYADWLQIPTQKIRTLNDFKYGQSISIDQKIIIPLKRKTIQIFEEQRYEYHKEIEEDFFESFAIQGIETYKVKNGDNIWNLCLNELEIPFWLLKKYNPGIDFNALHPLQIIRYPIVIKLV